MDRRDFLKSGVAAEVTVSIGTPGGALAALFCSIDMRARHLPGWPREQAQAMLLRVTETLKDLSLRTTGLDRN